jgi:ribosomal protein S12
MAVDAAEDWGQCEHRIVLTGHVHHDSVKDFPGVRVESVRVLAAADAWSYGAGYRSKRDMKRIDFHKEYGEVARQLVTPEMAS